VTRGKSPEWLDVVNALLDAGADVNVVDNNGTTALDAVRRKLTQEQEGMRRSLALAATEKGRESDASQEYARKHSDTIESLRKIERVLKNHGALPGDKLAGKKPRGQIKGR
jgi:hypothetical protein